MKRTYWDLIALVSFTLVGLASHLAWGRVQQPAVFFASTFVIIAALAFWSRWLWPRLTLWLTKFFCIAALIDLLAEGILQPFHGHTVIEKLTCQMTLFAAYATYLAVLRPLDAWLATRKARPAG